MDIANARHSGKWLISVDLVLPWKLLVLGNKHILPFVQPVNPVPTNADD